MDGLDDDTAVTDVTRPVAESQEANDCLVVVYPLDRAVGRRIKLDHTPVRIGRDPSNEFVLDDSGASRRHARLERRGEALVVMDVGSRNGTLVNDTELMGVMELKSGDRIKVGRTIFKYLSAFDLEAAFHDQIFQNTITDELTGLPNKRYISDELAREFARARRHGRPLSLLVVDIDHFKLVNDTQGHHMGDMVLRETAGTIRAALRADDRVARVGGEEFVALLPETDLPQAVEVAERLRERVADRLVEFRGVSVQVTVSVGCAQFEARDADPEALFRRADDKLYEAKHSGRNCVKA